MAADTAQTTVRVAVELPLPPADAWLALTEPARLGRWFGDLSGSLEPGGRARFDFGDGDFFAVEGIEAQPPTRLRYRWRFLGTGPVDTITWTVEPTPAGSRVTVTDEEPGRRPQAVKEMEEGWRDFTERLEGYAATGQVTRYDWRRDFEGSTPLEATPERAWDLLFSGDALERWLPFGGPPGEGAQLRVRDGQEPATVRISAVTREPPVGLRFQLSAEGWKRPTRCRLQLVPRAGAALLAVSQVGWEEISDDPSEAVRQRRRFGEAWVRALDRAAELAGGKEG